MSGIGLHNADNSFFQIDSADLKLDLRRVMKEDIIRLSIVEEVGKITSGNLVLNDPNIYYAKYLRIGVILQIGWGYKSIDDSYQSVLALKENPTEIGGSLAREGMEAYIMNPSGGGEDDGRGYYNCTFYGTEWSRRGDRRTYNNMTRAEVVHAVFDRIGVNSALREVEFIRGSEKLGGDTQAVQWETDFKFLQRIARDWRCIFRVSYNSLGQKVGLFVDYDKFDGLAFHKAVTGATYGNSLYLDWKGPVSNVIRYTWTNHMGEAGTGDHIRIVWIKGRPVVTRYIAETQTFKAYRLNTEKIEKEMKKRGIEGGISAQYDLIRWALNEDDFNNLVKEGYFVPYDQDTAPQGLGYSLNVHMLGNPLVSPPLFVTLGKGFPDTLANKQSKLFVRKVVHTIDKKGYKIDAEIVDTLTATGGSFVF